MKPRKPPRPFVTANFAITWDGRVSTREHTPADFSSKRDKRRLSEIRATADAVLVGASTIAADKMTMGISDPALRAERVKRKQSPYPLRVIVSNTGRISPTLRVFDKDFSSIVIFSTIITNRIYTEFISIESSTAWVSTRRTPSVSK